MEKLMTPDERDRTFDKAPFDKAPFDKALTRHLRSTPTSPAAANLPAGPPSQSASCLDPETLAAYHERSLLPDEMNSAKEHIVGCAHCQAILAHLEVTDSIALPAAEKQEVLVMTPAVAAKPRASRISHGVRWQWFAPASALAAGVLVWVAWHENRPPKLPGANEIKMAKAQEPSPPVPLNTRQAPAPPSSDELDAIARNRGEVGAVTSGVASSKSLQEAEKLKQQDKFDSFARALPAKPSPDKEAELRKDVSRDSSVALMRAENQSDLDAKNVVVGAGAAQEKAEPQNQAANIQSQNQIVAGKVAGPGPLSQVDQTKKTKSPSASPALTYREAAPAPPSQPAPAPPPPATPFNGETASMELTTAVSNSRLVAVPGTKLIWRAGRAGVIELSSNNGASWSRQTSGVLVDLTTGSAPSDKICWIVGRVGAIVRTTDGGEHWTVIHPPVEEDLVLVRAVDSLHATIWTARNLQAFETTDGGVTWKPISPP
jgi:hypothetical protein